MVTVALTACGTAPTAAPPAPAGPSGSAASKPPDPAPSRTETAVARPTESFTVNQPCSELVARMSLAERVGQLLMVAVRSTGVSPSEEAIVGRSRAGSVILLGNSTAGMRAIRGVSGHVRGA